MWSDNLAPTHIINESDEVDSYLESLGLTQDDLITPLERGLSGRYSTTRNHPVTSRGQYFYGEAVSGIRDVLAPKGFNALSVRNVELTTNGQIALYLCRGCTQTGLALGRPESRMKKGDFTRELMGLILNNTPGQGALKFEDKQLDFGFENSDTASPPLLPNKLGKDLWFLLYDLDEVDENGRMSIRAELSRPISYNDKNIVNDFSTRLILDTKRPSPVDMIGVEPQFTPDIDIDISQVG
ncbi:TPA: hypothetical protein RZL14_003549 [Yersinia enterocolitica]|uniref:hypothetical protein n=1 Tax=Yersinia kristensenii TaxID=28152 RepID=UPI0011A7D9D3|nr:hypothetical protein [Yersinia kristensenii]HEB9656541.1 hypothetical protein [Yersinia enterocolitica]